MSTAPNWTAIRKEAEHEVAHLEWLLRRLGSADDATVQKTWRDLQDARGAARWLSAREAAHPRYAWGPDFVAETHAIEAADRRRR